MTVIKGSLAKGSYFGTRLVRQRLASALSTGTGVTQAFDIDVSDFDNATVISSLTGAAITDLVLSVFVFDALGVLPHQIPLAPSVTPTAQIIVAGAVLAVQQYDLRGISVVRINAKNANAGTQTLNFIDIFCGVTGADIN